ncbi:MAG: molybdenum cofactor biosynthesis protein MoaE [Verrucomicrobiaceae bacterium]|nr:molybdenum cofactor biosynthesis protein MoaE [Verrucomicrobiaceae bacterium]
MPTLNFLLTNKPILSETPQWDEAFGAEVVFWGVVRGTENEQPIAGIHYTAYPRMVEKMLLEMGDEARRIFCEHRAQLIHRTGLVPTAQPAVVLRVGCSHSQEAFEISRWYLDKLKRVVPIWKRVVPENNPS